MPIKICTVANWLKLLLFNQTVSTCWNKYSHRLTQLEAPKELTMRELIIQRARLLFPCYPTPHLGINWTYLNINRRFKCMQINNIKKKVRS